MFLLGTFVSLTGPACFLKYNYEWNKYFEININTYYIYNVFTPVSQYSFF